MLTDFRSHKAADSVKQTYTAGNRLANRIRLSEVSLLNILSNLERTFKYLRKTGFFYGSSTGLLSAPRRPVGMSTTTVAPSMERSREPGHMIKRGHFHWSLCLTSHNSYAVYSPVHTCVFNRFQLVRIN